jgi:hypothetical protein
LNRKEVEIVTEASKIRKRRIYTEEEYDLKCGVEPPKVAKVSLDKNTALDDIEAQLAQLESHDSADEMEISKPSPSKLYKTPPVKKIKKKAPLKTPPAKKMKKVPVVSQITPPNEVDQDSSDDEEFRGFKMNKTQSVNGNAFGIEFGLECDEIVENHQVNSESAKNEETFSKFEVLFSPGLLTQMKKVLKKDQEAMSVLNKIKKSGRNSLVTATTPITQIKKGPTDYPMPPSPESSSLVSDGELDSGEGGIG